MFKAISANKNWSFLLKSHVFLQNDVLVIFILHSQPKGDQGIPIPVCLSCVPCSKTRIRHSINNFVMWQLFMKMYLWWETAFVLNQVYPILSNCYLHGIMPGMDAGKAIQLKMVLQNNTIYNILFKLLPKEMDILS